MSLNAEGMFESGIPNSGASEFLPGKGCEPKVEKMTTPSNYTQALDTSFLSNGPYLWNLNVSKINHQYVLYDSAARVQMDRYLMLDPCISHCTQYFWFTVIYNYLKRGSLDTTAERIIICISHKVASLS